MDSTELARAVLRVIEDTEAEYARMPFFVRPMVRRGLAKRTGRDVEGWRRVLADAARGTIAPGLARELAALAAHYDGAPERARRGMGAREDELREVERRARERAAAVRALAAAL